MNIQNNSKLVLFSIYVATPIPFVLSAISNLKENGFILTACIVIFGFLQMVMLDLRYKLAFWINFLPLVLMGTFIKVVIFSPLFDYLRVEPVIGGLFAVLDFFIILGLPILFYKQRQYFANKFNIFHDMRNLYQKDNMFWMKYILAIAVFSVIQTILESHH